MHLPHLDVLLPLTLITLALPVLKCTAPLRHRGRVVQPASGVRVRPVVERRAHVSDEGREAQVGHVRAHEGRPGAVHTRRCRGRGNFAEVHEEVRDDDGRDSVGEVMRRRGGLGDWNARSGEHGRVHKHLENRVSKCRPPPVAIALTLVATPAMCRTFRTNSTLQRGRAVSMCVCLEHDRMAHRKYTVPARFRLAPL